MLAGYALRALATNYLETVTAEQHGDVLRCLLGAKLVDLTLENVQRFANTRWMNQHGCDGCLYKLLDRLELMDWGFGD